jgi:hypothetical protein
MKRREFITQIRPLIEPWSSVVRCSSKQTNVALGRAGGVTCWARSPMTWAVPIS